MGYVSGIRWTDETIKKEIFNVMKVLEINRMPTSVEIMRISNNSKLTNAIRRHGGTESWAKKLGLGLSKCETRTGKSGELEIKNILENMGYIVKITSVKHPYDLLVNGDIKIDVKYSNLYKNPDGWGSYSYNLEKKNPTCDIYIFIKSEAKEKLIIPSKFLHQTQLCITNNISKYDKYKNRWDYIKQYDDFYKSIF